jgi:hypothetical protein
MKINRPRREWCEAYKPEIDAIIAAVRDARGAKPNWYPMVTDGLDIGDLFGDRDDHEELMQLVASALGVDLSGTIIDVARRIRGK